MKTTAPCVQPIPASYQPVPLASYTQALQQAATGLFQRVAQRVSAARVTNPPDGSFSIRGGSSRMTAAKIIIYESGRGTIIPGLADGVYVLIRTSDAGKSRARTIGVAPLRHKRFAYLKLSAGQDLEEMADFIAACADAL
jgi:hypothetical protein